MLVLLATRLAVCGGWSGVGSDNNPAALCNASRTLSHLPIPLYKPLQSLPFEPCKTVLTTV
ncbi:hypothetical protein CE153_05260 [Bifidobacterium sp. N4G05]|nr:hypothetical protein CE153_05260 [Bifidobacterium sp. N4G05]